MCNKKNVFRKMHFFALGSQSRLPFCVQWLCAGLNQMPKSQRSTLALALHVPKGPQRLRGSGWCQRAPHFTCRCVTSVTSGRTELFGSQMHAAGSLTHWDVLQHTWMIWVNLGIYYMWHIPRCSWFISDSLDWLQNID